MKKFNGYEETQAYRGFEKLPEGGYVTKIQNVKYMEGKNGNSDMIILAFDVIEGEHKDYFKNQFESQTGEDKKWKGTFTIYCPKDDGSEKDGWTKRSFKTIMEDIEASNPGYAWNWDENTLKNKIFGVIFGEVNDVIDGKQIKYNKAKKTATVDNIRKGNFKIPKPQYRNGAKIDSGEKVSGNEDFMSVEGTNEEIPF